MVDSGDRKRQVSLFESFGALKKIKISEASSTTSVEASYGDDVGGDCSGDTYSDGHDNSDLGNDVLNAADLSECENDDLVGK